MRDLYALAVANLRDEYGHNHKPLVEPTGPRPCCGEFSPEPNELGYAFCPICDRVMVVKQ